MNKQANIYYYDQESYENHQAKIAALMQKEQQLLEELNNLDKHYIDNIIIPAALARAEQKLAAVRAELAKMKGMQIKIVNTDEKSNTIGIPISSAKLLEDGQTSREQDNMILT